MASASRALTAFSRVSRVLSSATLPSVCLYSAFASSTVLSSLLSATALVAALRSVRRFLSSLVVLCSDAVVLSRSDVAASDAQEPLMVVVFAPRSRFNASRVLGSATWPRLVPFNSLEALAVVLSRSDWMVLRVASAESHALIAVSCASCRMAATWRFLICSPIQDTAMRLAAMTIATSAFPAGKTRRTFRSSRSAE